MNIDTTKALGPFTLQLQSFFESRLSSYLHELRQMVEINSFTRNPAGVAALAGMTQKLFAQLGFSARSVPSNDSSLGDHLVLSCGPDTAPIFGLVSHLDTVFSPEDERENDFCWREVGNRLYGPGTCDIKGGTIVAFMVLDALKTLAPEAFRSIQWKVLLNSSEEIFSQDFAHLMRTELPPSHTLACLVFEKAGQVDGMDLSLVVARKGRLICTLTVHGRGAHAGNEPHHGANAIVQMSRLVEKIHQLNDPSKKLTLNVGVINGGTVVNRVPHLAVCEIEVRAFSPGVLARTKEKLRELNKEISVQAQSDGYACSVECVIHAEDQPWDVSPGAAQLFGYWSAAATELGIKLTQEHRGGLSDANHIGPHVPTIDGLGPIGAFDHSSQKTDDGTKDQEYAERDSFVPLATLHVTAILKLLQQTPLPKPQ